MNHLKKLILRTLALIGAEAGAVIAGGSLLGINAWTAAATAGIAAAITVWATLGRAYYTDGKLTAQEENQAFTDKDKK
jgi:lactam utilization protein B